MPPRTASTRRPTASWPGDRHPIEANRDWSKLALMLKRFSEPLPKSRSRTPIRSAGSRRARRPALTSAGGRTTKGSMSDLNHTRCARSAACRLTVTAPAVGPTVSARHQSSQATTLSNTSLAGVRLHQCAQRGNQVFQLDYSLHAMWIYDVTPACRSKTVQDHNSLSCLSSCSASFS
jgi:hypothetical protein